MSEADELAPTPPRAGTYADLARRMDRMEQRHENLEGEVRNLTATVARVETNQEHATELNKLRFDALDNGLKAVSVQTARIESILAGEVETAVSRRNAELFAEYQDWREEVDKRLDEQDARNARSEGRNDGVRVAVGGVKGLIVVVAAALSPVITIVALLLNQ